MDDVAHKGRGAQDSEQSRARVDLRALARVRPGLSAKLLILTAAFVMLAEVLIFIPSVATFRHTWLMNRVAAAATAALVFDAAHANMVPPEVGKVLLEQLGAQTIWARRSDSRLLVATVDNPPQVDVSTDLREMRPFAEISEAMDTLLGPSGRILRITANGMNGLVINMTIKEDKLRQAMLGFARSVLVVSLLISLITAALVYLALIFMIVRPIKRLSQNMAEFEREPENAARMMAPTHRSDEIGLAERSLARLETKLADELRLSKRLAALGLMIAKISHDLRNVLSGAQLFSERIAELRNPSVQRLAPRLVDALRRAIDLCEGTLTYGADQRAALKPSTFKLAPLVAECWELALPVVRQVPAKLMNSVPQELELTADRDQMARVFLNLMRNSLQAIVPNPQQQPTPEARVSVTAESGADGALISVEDNGPGVPEAMRSKLFEPFSASSSRRGSGLGLAIVADILRAHDGDIRLVDSTTGARFEIRLPAARVASGEPIRSVA